MEILASLKVFIATFSATILAFLGFVEPVQQMAVASPEIVQQIEIQSTTTPVVEKTIEKKTTLVEAYELGKAVGKIEAQVEKIEKIVAETPKAIPQPVTESTQNTPQPTQTLPTQEPIKIMEPKASQAALVTFFPDSNRGLGARIDQVTGKDLGLRSNDYKINPDGTLAEGSTNPDDTNMIVVGAKCLDFDGNISPSKIQVETTDSSQNREITSNGQFTYEFKTSGKHTITFKCDGMETKVDIDGVL